MERRDACKFYGQHRYGGIMREQVLPMPRGGVAPRCYDMLPARGNPRRHMLACEAHDARMSAPCSAHVAHERAPQPKKRLLPLRSSLLMVERAFNHALTVARALLTTVLCSIRPSDHQTYGNLWNVGMLEKS